MHSIRASRTNGIDNCNCRSSGCSCQIDAVLTEAVNFQILNSEAASTYKLYTVQAGRTGRAKPVDRQVAKDDIIRTTCRHDYPIGPTHQYASDLSRTTIQGDGLGDG